MSVSYALTLAGGVITAVVGVLMMLLGSLLGSFTPFHALIGPFIVAFGLWGLAAGTIIIYSAAKLRTKEHKSYALVAVIFSILALATLQGMLIGPLLSLIGSAMAYGEGKKR